MDFLFDGPEGGPLVVLAHGAGAPMDSGFMAAFATGLGERGMRVARFEFPYMLHRRETGSRRPPDREAVLLQTWREAVAALGGGSACVIGGKSMGGRMASMVADELGVPGLVCLGYPFHAPGRPEKPRIAHLQSLRTPALIVQGTRDPFGSQGEVAAYGLSSAIRVLWMEDGNHDLEPRSSPGRTRSQNWEEAMDAVSEFIKHL
jgi:predicted alpha/beta-hydrolase family hydrolase